MSPHNTTFGPGRRAASVVSSSPARMTDFALPVQASVNAGPAVKTEANSVAALHAHAPYLVQSYIATAGALHAYLSINACRLASV